MKIGIDLDDTICCTTEIVREKVEEYALKTPFTPYEILNDEKLRKEFFNLYLEKIYLEVKVKKHVCEVLKRLKTKGNQIYIITARNHHFSSSVKDVLRLTQEWLHNNQIEVDAIFTSAYGDSKVEICQKYHIDLMIDDDPYNYKKILASGAKCLLFDDKEKYCLKENYVTSWLEIEKYIERNH